MTRDVWESSPLKVVTDTRECRRRDGTARGGGLDLNFIELQETAANKPTNW